MNLASTIPVIHNIRPGQFSRITFEANDDKAPPADDKKKEDDKVEFTPAQQTFLQTKFDEAFGKGYGKAEKAFTTKITEMQALIDKLTAGGGDKKDDKNDDGKDKRYTQAEVQAMIDEALKEPNAKLDTVAKREAASKERTRLAAMTSAAAKAKALDADEVATLASKFIAYDEDGDDLVVLGENGKPRLNAKGDPMSVDEFFKQFVDSKPHLKAGSNLPGTGSRTDNSQTPTGKPKNSSEANKMLGDFFSKNRL